MCNTAYNLTLPCDVRWFRFLLVFRSVTVMASTWRHTQNEWRVLSSRSRLCTPIALITLLTSCRRSHMWQRFSWSWYVLLMLLLLLLLLLLVLLLLLLLLLLLFSVSVFVQVNKCKFIKISTVVDLICWHFSSYCFFSEHFDYLFIIRYHNDEQCVIDIRKSVGSLISFICLSHFLCISLPFAVNYLGIAASKAEFLWAVVCFLKFFIVTQDISLSDLRLLLLVNIASVYYLTFCTSYCLKLPVSLT